MTPNKLLTRLPVLLAQIKAKNNSDKLKKYNNNNISCISIIISSKKFTKIMEENIVIIREPKTFDFDFDLHKDLDKNLKHKIEFVIKSNNSLPENKIKNKIEQLLSK